MTRASAWSFEIFLRSLVLRTFTWLPIISVSKASFLIFLKPCGDIGYRLAVPRKVLYEEFGNKKRYYRPDYHYAVITACNLNGIPFMHGNMSIHPTQMTKGRSSTTIKQHTRFLFMVCLWPIRLEAFSVGQIWRFATSRSARSVQLRYHSKGEGWAEGCQLNRSKFSNFKAQSCLWELFLSCILVSMFQSLQTWARCPRAAKRSAWAWRSLHRWLRWEDLLAVSY